MNSAKQVFASIVANDRKPKSFQQVRCELGCTADELKEELLLLQVSERRKYPFDTAIAVLANRQIRSGKNRNRPISIHALIRANGYEIQTIDQLRAVKRKAAEARRSE